MNFTSREEYGLLAVMHLAASSEPGPIQSREIAKAEEIPEQFLEQVLAALRRAGIVRSIRGAAGGYGLARPAREITPGDVVRALSGEILPISTRTDTRRLDRMNLSVVIDLWQKVQEAISNVLDSMTIQDMVDERARLQQNFIMMNI